MYETFSIYSSYSYCLVFQTVIGHCIFFYAFYRTVFQPPKAARVLRSSRTLIKIPIMVNILPAGLPVSPFGGLTDTVECLREILFDHPINIWILLYLITVSLDIYNRIVLFRDSMGFVCSSILLLSSSLSSYRLHDRYQIITDLS